MDVATPKKASNKYWVVVLVLVFLGAFTIFSLGLYFWFMAAAMIVLSPFRTRPRIFRTGLALVLGFLIAYVLIAPWSCAQSLTFGPIGQAESPVVCTSPIGIEYSGPEPFEPSLFPAVIGAGATAAVAAAIAWALGGRTDGDRRSPGDV